MMSLRVGRIDVPGHMRSYFSIFSLFPESRTIFSRLSMPSFLVFVFPRCEGNCQNTNIHMVIPISVLPYGSIPQFFAVHLSGSFFGPILFLGGKPKVIMTEGNNNDNSDVSRDRHHLPTRYCWYLSYIGQKI